MRPRIWTPRRVLQMIALLHEAHAVMCEGQSLDLQFESERSSISPVTIA